MKIVLAAVAAMKITNNVRSGIKVDALNNEQASNDSYSIMFFLFAKEYIS